MCRDSTELHSVQDQGFTLNVFYFDSFGKSILYVIIQSCRSAYSKISPVFFCETVHVGQGCPTSGLWTTRSPWGVNLQPLGSRSRCYYPHHSPPAAGVSRFPFPPPTSTSCLIPCHWKALRLKKVTQSDLYEEGCMYMWSQIGVDNLWSMAEIWLMKRCDSSCSSSGNQQHSPARAVGETSTGSYCLPRSVYFLSCPLKSAASSLFIYISSTASADW